VGHIHHVQRVHIPWLGEARRSEVLGKAARFQGALF